MKQLGQIIYNYYTNNQIWFTGQNGLEKIPDTETPSPIWSDPSKNLFNFAESPLYGKTITKLGVQAPEGSVLVINDTNQFVIGHTEILELEEQNITSLFFENFSNNIIIDYLCEGGVE